MSVVQTVPIAYRPMDGFDWFTEQMNDRIQKKAFEYYRTRGFADGRDWEDWFRAEAALVMKPHVVLNRVNENLFVEIALPVADPNEIMLFVGDQEIAVGTHPNDEGRQFCRVIQLPETIEIRDLEAEFGDGTLRVTA